jgi:hypothetical protein
MTLTGHVRQIHVSDRPQAGPSTARRRKGLASRGGKCEGLGRQKAIATASSFIDDRLVPEREDLFAYYAGQDEGQRLFRFAHNRLELLRTRELLLRQLPSPPVVVLNVGGGTGVQRLGWRAGATACTSSMSSRSMSEP